ncbi:MAG: lipoate--protein ligase [Bacteroides sp.]|nr:lipoate--protein ligase [Bacteroides sp.]
MDLVILNDSQPRRLAFYLAEEEYLAHHYPERDFFFAWQVKPSVIVGRHQLLQKEIDVDFCKDKGIEIFRRKSGGGAVVADMNNIMFSYVTSSDDVCSTFGEYTSMIASALRQLGLEASDNSRNDILIGDRKVSGNAYYHLPGRSIVHGTMLYDYDPALMATVLRPSVTKLASHGVKSVHSRVTTIREHRPDLSLPDFLDHVIRHVCHNGNTLVLSNDEIKEIEKIEQEYYNPQWIEGNNPKGTIRHRERIENVGEIEVDMSLSRGMIDSLTLTGDFFGNAEAESTISNALTGTPYDKDSVSLSLAKIDFPKLINGLTTERFVDLIF